MCGITGGLLFNRQPFSRRVLERMTEVISHRGPDDSGTYIDNHLALGFRRLSIIDLSPLGHQPMSIADGRYNIVFNGEIYNFEGLRKELEEEGVQFRSKTDTEVILHLYARHGVLCFARLRGMFGIAIWDNNEQVLVLARDRVGKKPLYVYRDHQKLLFASELKSIYQYPDVEYKINPEALSEYFSYGFIGSPRTIYQAVSKLEPGCYMTVDPSGKTSASSYWNWRPTPPSAVSFEEAKQQVFAKVDESIRIRMRSDVPLGAFLSGGIDSSIVVARMAAHSATPVKTFTIGFEDKAYDESGYAAMVARQYSTDHHVEIINPDYAHLIESVVSHFDEPFGDSSALPTHVVSQMISKHVTVALSGDGGDEVFGGYEIYLESLAQQKFDKAPLVLKKMAALLDPVFPDTLPGRNYLRRFAIANPYDRFVERYKLISDPERKKLLSKIHFTDTSALKKKYFNELQGHPDFLSFLRYNDIKHYLEGDILAKVDRTTMLNSIESRSPLLDHELIELSFTLPGSFLIQGGQGKFILREAFKKQIPPALLNRPKKGFSLPLANWFRHQLKDYFADLVFQRDLEASGLINIDYARHLFSIHQSKKRDLSAPLWLLLAFAIWHRNVYLKLKKNEHSRIEEIPA